ncbi:MAG: hypothetical protein WAV32_03730 [Halobacteriota archaeon]
MDTLKIILLAIMVTAVGVLILPDAVLLIAEQTGEHRVPIPPAVCEALSATNHVSDARYEIYSAQVAAELRVSAAHRSLSCDDCHRSPLNDFEFHVECLDCHGDTGNISGHWTYQECRNCSKCHHGSNISSYKGFLAAGGFDLNATAFEIERMEGHGGLIRAAMENPQMVGANEACIACHTQVKVNISQPKHRYMSLKVSTEHVVDFSATGGRQHSEGKLFEIS